MPAYPEKTIDELIEAQAKLSMDLQLLMVESIRQGNALPPSLAKEHLVNGAGRRLGALSHATDTIFSLFPLRAAKPIPRNDLADIQASLQVFLMNLYGLFENWGWAFVLRHDLEQAVGGRNGIGLFSRGTQKMLPRVLREYVTAEGFRSWHDNYLKSYRDALAHRIPPYLPPAMFTAEEGKRFNALESEKLDCLRQQNLDRLAEVELAQKEVGRPCWTFLHAFSEADPPRPILLHGQLITDGLGVIECGQLFLANWHITAKDEAE